MATGYSWTVRGSNPGGGEIFRTSPDRPWGLPSLLYKGYRVFPVGKERTERDADPSPLLVLWSRKSRAITLLPLWAVRPVQSLIACTRVRFTLLYANELQRICQPVPVAARSKAWVCGRSPAEIVGSNPAGARTPVSYECCALSGRGLCDELINGLEESYRLWCVVVCDLETS